MFERTAAFTGPRPHKLPYSESDPQCANLKKRIREMIILHYHQGVRRFLSGAASGVDMWAAEIVIELKEKYPDIELVCVVPFRAQADRWSTRDQVRYRNILESAEVIYTGEVMGENSYRIRNQHLVDHAKYLIAIFDSEANQRRSGTSMTVNMAKRAGSTITYIKP